MALSKYIQDFSRKIEQTSDTELSWAQRSTAPHSEWIPENLIAKMSAINFRTAEETKNGNDMKLQQFNPSFFLKESSEVYCRFPDCSSKTRRLKPTNSSEKIKQDLFLCQTHRTKLMSDVSERCAKENVKVEDEDFSGYAHLIGQLEKAFTHTTGSSSYDPILVEVFLNTRNFLIITNAFLSPDDDNVKTSLTPYMAVLREFLCVLKDPKLVENLRNALQEVMNTILQFFGIIYQWVFMGNPGERVGAGLGLVAGFLGAVRLVASPYMAVASIVIGFISGKLIGGGGYEWHRENQYMELQKQMVQEYYKVMSMRIGQNFVIKPSFQLFHVQATPEGGLLFNPEMIFQ